MRVLVIEDSERLQRSLAAGLARSGFSVDVAGDGEEGLEYALAADYEVLVLDLMLPKMSGLEVLERLRGEHYDAHILILSARDQVADRVKGLEMGADDYLVKPFSFDELVARLRALTRRHHDEKCPVVQVGTVAVDTSRRCAQRGEQRICLTPKEYALLEFLALRRGQVFSKDRLIEQLYPYDSDVSENMIEVLVSGLRKKLYLRDEPPLIETRRGFGYLIDA
ncbi:MAG: response regulator transcription factor [Thermoanaerobaculia bacterium]|nr:response regulator transcription factor [Thermoanaerobaculia bacterium]